MEIIARDYSGDASLYFQYSSPGAPVVIGGAAGATNNLVVPNGSIGINTTAPQAALDVNGFILINSAGTVVEGNSCAPIGLVGRDSNCGLFDCQYDATSGTTTWGRPQTFTRITTNIGTVNSYCVIGDPSNPPNL